jgi:hypothetical protein
LFILIGKIGSRSYRREFNISPANYDYFTNGKNALNSTGVKVLLKDIKTKHEQKHGKIKKGEKFTCKLVAKE